MARCCGPTLPVVLEEGNKITIAGDGTPQSPYVIGADVAVAAYDTTQFNVAVTGAGTVASPYLVSVAYASTAKLNAIPDVATTTPTNGQVLAWNTGSGKWTPVAPTTAAAGSVNHDSSLLGDGSIGSPLQVQEDANGGLTTGGAGLGLTNAAKLAQVRPFADAAARTAATPAPTINSLTMLGTKPGVVDYWTGSTWAPIKAEIDVEATGQVLALSGSYTGGPVREIIRQMTVTTDVDGTFDLLTTTDLAGAAGVVSAIIQPVGAVPFVHTVTPQIDHVEGVAYALDGTAYANQNLSFTLTALLY